MQGAVLFCDLERESGFAQIGESIQDLLVMIEFKRPKI